MARDQRWYPRLKTQRINSLVNSYCSPPSRRGWGALQGRQAARLSSRRCSPSPPSPPPGPRPLPSWSTAWWSLSPSWTGQVTWLRFLLQSKLSSSYFYSGSSFHPFFLAVVLFMLCFFKLSCHDGLIWRASHFRDETLLIMQSLIMVLVFRSSSLWFWALLWYLLCLDLIMPEKDSNLVNGKLAQGL